MPTKTSIYRLLFLLLLAACLIFLYSFKITNNVIAIGKKKQPRTIHLLDSNSSRLFINHKSFRGITKQEKRLTMKLLIAFDEFMSKHNIPYFIWGGSLLGSYRHHGMIPWDDDIDVYMDLHTKPMLKFLLKDNLPKVKDPKDATLLLNGEYVRWKIFWNVSGAVKAKDFMWPYIDISFYNLTTNRKTGEICIADIDPAYRYYYPVADLFPLVKRPYESYLFPAPKCSSNIFVRRSVNITKCCTNTFDHKLERGISKNICTDCSNLMNSYSFVRREKYNATHNREILEGPNGEEEGVTWIVNKDC